MCKDCKYTYFKVNLLSSIQAEQVSTDYLDTEISSHYEGNHISLELDLKIVCTLHQDSGEY